MATVGPAPVAAVGRAARVSSRSTWSTRRSPAARPVPPQGTCSSWSAAREPAVDRVATAARRDGPQCAPRRDRPRRRAEGQARQPAAVRRPHRRGRRSPRLRRGDAARPGRHLGGPPRRGRRLVHARRPRRAHGARHRRGQERARHLRQGHGPRHRRRPRKHATPRRWRRRPNSSTSPAGARGSGAATTPPSSRCSARGCHLRPASLGTPPGRPGRSGTTTRSEPNTTTDATAAPIAVEPRSVFFLPWQSGWPGHRQRLQPAGEDVPSRA